MEPTRSLLRGFLFLLCSAPLLADSKHQVFSDFITPLPLRQGDSLVIGILGGWERWDAPERIVRRIGMHLRERNVPRTFIETVENHKLHLARELVEKAFDHNQDGKLDDSERLGARVIVYGQSLGGSATVRLCRWLKEQRIAVRLSVQIDSVGVRDRKIPSNVREAANLYQHDLGPIRGQTKIRADDPKATLILGNWRYRYPFWKYVNTEEEPLIRKLFINPHVKMEYDPEVWDKVEGLILSALRNW